MKPRCTFTLATLMLLVGLGTNATAQDPPPIPPFQPPGIRLDFQDVELGLVLSALADAGNFNLIYADLPPRRVTLRMNQPVLRDQVLPLLRSIAESNGLQLIQDGTLLRIQAAEVAVVQADALTGGGAQTPSSELQLFVYRLQHARAARLAQTLQAMFTGTVQRLALDTRSRTLSQQLRDQRIPPMRDMDVPADATDLPGAQDTAFQEPVLGELIIVPDEPTNSLLVRAQPADWEVLEQAIQSLDVRPLQAMIEVVIAEVRRTSDLEVGVTGTAGRTNSDGTVVTGQLGGFTAGDFALQVMRSGYIDFTAAISALAVSGSVNILSRPVVLAQNNQEARILIGDERPFVQVFRSLPTDAGVRDQVVQYRDVGTSLTIVPTISDDGYVNLEVTQEVSAATTEQQFGAPVISTREASTHLFVRDGQTVVIGGLMEDQQQRSRSGIPLLKDIPLLGLFFGTTQRFTSQSELFIFLTPHIVATDADADGLRNELEGRTDLMENWPINRPDTTSARINPVN